MAVTELTALDGGLLPQISFTAGIFQQIDASYNDMKLIQKLHISDPLAREFRFQMLLNGGPGAIGMSNVGASNRAFPAADPEEFQEVTGRLREQLTTLSINEQVYDRAKRAASAGLAYAQPIEVALAAKKAHAMQKIATMFYRDGLGVLGTLASNALGVVTLRTEDSDRGGVGQLIEGDLVVHKSATGGSGTSVTVAAGTFDYWKVSSVNRRNNQATLIPVNTLGAETTVSSWTATAGEILIGEHHNTNGTVANPSSVTDYGTETDDAVGIEAWGRTSGTVFGVSMTGVTAATRYDNGGSVLDFSTLRSALTEVKTRSGNDDTMQLEDLIMAPEAQDTLVNALEADKYFVNQAPNEKGIKGRLLYRHGADYLEVTTAKSAQKNRIYSFPKEIIQFHGTDVTPIMEPGAQSIWRLRPASGGGHVNMLNAYMRQYVQFVCVMPRKLLTIHDFALS